MQPLITAASGLLERLSGNSAVPQSEPAAARSDLRWGLAGVVLVLIMLAGVGVVYVADTEQRTYTADLADAGSVRPGDSVRVAGVTVGKVRSLALGSDRATMTFTVDDEVFVGAQSTLDVRMLTVVGGHYVALIPAGSKPLGHTTIPMDRVVLPYSLPQVFQDAIAPIRKVDGDVLRRDFAALQNSIDKSPHGIGQALTAAGTIVDILDRQNADISRALTVADEYLSAIDTNKDVIIRLIRTLGVLITLVENNKFQVAKQLDLLASTVQRVVPLGQAWQSTLKPMAQPLAESIPKLTEIGTRLGELLESLREFGARLQPLVTPQGGVSIDQSGTTITAPALCVPVPGRTC
ncbi:MlaD family protein [Nocardia sp. XZ_19_385]|uniref:MlaD family protein n=1 Tax=Nocardia sp. XZ_19_385 TaxID=2769488 RepID=UPI00281582B6|nr:MlaD family protein [Nocardia sp. XZ_19_385]